MKFKKLFSFIAIGFMASIPTLTSSAYEVKPFEAPKVELEFDLSEKDWSESFEVTKHFLSEDGYMVDTTIQIEPVEKQADISIRNPAGRAQHITWSHRAHVNSRGGTTTMNISFWVNVNSSGNWDYTLSAPRFEQLTTTTGILQSSRILIERANFNIYGSGMVSAHAFFAGPSRNNSKTAILNSLGHMTVQRNIW